MASFIQLLLTALIFLPLTTLLSAVNNFSADSIQELLYRQGGVEEQVQILTRRIDHQDQMVHAFRRLIEKNQNNAELASLVARFNELEKEFSDAINQWNQLTGVLDEYKKAIAQLESHLLRLEKTVSHLVLALDQGSTTLYTIQKGDTLEKIARRFGTSISAIKQLNGLKNDSIIAGNSLKIAE